VESLLRDNRDVPWNRSKIMLVGQGGAGKTALANHMMGKVFEGDPKSTIGAKKFERKLTSGKMRKGEKGAILEEYLSSPKELESVMAMTASRKMSILKVKDSVKGEHSSPRSAEDTSSVSSIPISVVDTAIFNTCLSENIARKDLGTALIISLYDFGGQDIFNVLHPFFMSKYGVYVVVFDMELFLSKDEEKRESCMKHLKFWMNSIVMCTYDEKSGQAAPVALVGTRGDVISNPEDYKRVSITLEESFYRSAAWNSLIVNYFEGASQRGSLINTENGLSFFPVDNKQLFSPGVSVTPLLDACLGLLEDADFVKKPVSFIWLKILDEVKSKGLSFISRNEVEQIATCYSMSVKDVPDMLAFLYEMGMVLWVNEGKLADIVILDPIKYFVKPATRIICKHIATKDDPHHIIHCKDIHKACRKEWPDDWYQMLEFGLVSERLARRLLASVCKNDFHIDNVLLLMEKYGLTTGFHVVSSVDDTNVFRICFLPAIAPSDPKEYFLDRKYFENYSIFMDYVNLIGRLGSKRSSCFHVFDCVVFHFAFSVSTDLLKFPLLSAHDVAFTGFLPNGLFERFVGKVLGSLVSTISDVSASLLRTSFIGLKDVVKLKFMFRDVRITNLLESNMIRIEVEREPEENNDKGTLMFIHDSLYEMIQTIIRECYKNLLVVTLLLTDQQDYHNHPLLPLSELKSVVEGKMRSIDYHTVDGKQVLSKRAKELETSFSIWLNTSTIHPKKGQYVNKVCCYFCLYVYSCLLFY
jgi:GTPase SAR1 family protein